MLFDCHKLSWTSGEDMHLAVCRALLERGVQPVIVYAGISPILRERYEAAGVIVEQVNYGHGSLRYFRRMRAIFRRYRVETVDIEFFSYFQPIAWMARLNGVKNIVFTESNSGLMRAKSWKLTLLQLRAALATLPVRRFVASFRVRALADVAPGPERWMHVCRAQRNRSPTLHTGSLRTGSIAQTVWRGSG